MSASRLRVALIALHFTEYSLRLAQALSEHHEVLLMLDREAAQDQLESKLWGDSARLQILGLSDFRSLVGLTRGINLIGASVRDFAPDVLHFQEVATPLGLLAALSLARIPQVLTVHDPTPHSGDDTLSPPNIRRLVTLAMFRRLCRVALTHGERLVADLERVHPRLKGLVFSVPHGPLGGPPLSVESEPGCLLFFGRIQKYKGLGNFVEAVRRLHASGVPVRGVIAGRGPDLDPYRRQILGHPAFELHERYIGADELPALFGRAQAVVLPYIDGTQSGVAALALGYGRAIVSTRVGAVQEMVRDGDNGIVVPPGDLDALTTAMGRLIGQPALVARLAQRSAELGQTELSWARNADVSADAYRVALAMRQRS